MFIYAFIPNLILISIFLGAALGCVSSYAVVRKWSFIGDIISHSALPGVVYMFLATQTQNYILLIIGGGVSALLSSLISFYIQKNTLLPRDSGFAIILSWFFSLGIIGMTIIQKISISGQSMINNFIYGNIVTFASGKILFYIIFSILFLIIFFALLNIQKSVAFDIVYTQIRYKYMFLLETILLISSVFIIVIGLQVVGILLMGALIIAPGSFAKMICGSYLKMIFCSMILTILSFLFGVSIGIYFSHIPSGPIIALIPVCSCILMVLYYKIIELKKN